MRGFRERTCDEAIIRACALLTRTAGRDAALDGLAAVFRALAAGELPAAVTAYHTLTAGLLARPARRVSGDLWLDALLHMVLQAPHPFALLAAAGRHDEAIEADMAELLAILGELSTLHSEDIARYVAERQRESLAKPRQGKDSISILSSAVWAGANTRPLPRTGESEPAAPAPLPIPFAFSPWHYGESALRDSFAADEALEELYPRLLATADWAALAGELYGFFSAYGCGDFLQSRAFYLEAGGLVPLPEDVTAPIVPVSLYERQRTLLIEEVIRFMRGERATHLLLLGPAGTGKSAHVFALPHELPEVRLIVADEAGLARIPALLDTLAGQPLRFVLLLEDIHPDGVPLRTLAARLCALRAVPANVLLCATARQEGGSGLFPLCLRFAYPTPGEFTRMAAELLEAEGIRADQQALHAACLDYQVDARDALGFAGARRIAERYARGD